ncbi:MAG: bifunctional demethylmenaquinone methyltransferase/2-methoxy-6-polyprenyl-1,4-benzoquinol methylase UbiE [Pseudomonadota bacterium]
MSDSTTHFGYRDVAVQDKQALVGEVFTSVAGNYDLMNDLMSLGIHRLWKRHFVSTLRLRPGMDILDLAGGTGDIAALMAPKLGDTGHIVLGDINAAMLSVGRDRLLDRGRANRVTVAQMNAEALPFPDQSLDRITMAFGLRNVTHKEKALAEMARVLRPGGMTAILEFSQVRPELLRPFYDWYSFNVLPRLGARFAGDPDSYQYLAESIRKHPNQESLKEMMVDAGLEMVGYRNLTMGICAIHEGFRT